jgi:hypothetical protein
LGAPPAQAAGTLDQHLLTTIEPNTIKRRGTGFRGYDPQRVSPGSTLFTSGNTVYLVDVRGNQEHSWTLPYQAGLYGYLTERGTLLYNGNLSTGRFPAGVNLAMGGVVLEANWNGQVLWELRQPDHHHDARLLRNGNVLIMCGSELPDEIARHVQGGIPGTEANGKIFADYLLEMLESCWRAAKIESRSNT